MREDTKDVYFTIIFDELAGLRDRTYVQKILQRFLLEHPGFDGPLAAETLGSPPKLDAVIVRRGILRRTIGPKFSQFSTGSWQPLQIGKLEEKLRPGRYPSSIPLELFAYAVHDEPDAALGSLETLQEAAIRLLPRSSFRRVHIFDFGLRRHLWSYPG